MATQSIPPAQPRAGPRPLPLHLATSVWTWQSSELGLPLLSGDWRQWSGASASSNEAAANELAASFARHQAEFRRRLTVLAGQIAALAPDADTGKFIAGDFTAALRRESTRRFERLVDGILAYRRHPVHRDLEEPAVLASDGNARLLDYAPFAEGAAATGAALFMVPSLVNRWQVLDLNRERSFMRAMARAGIRPLLVDWGTPEGAERDFDSTAYVARLNRLYDAARRVHPGKMAIGGYCMGGLLALALGLQRQDQCAGLLLLATPWDFAADRAGQAGLMSSLAMLDRLVQSMGELPVDALQTLFYSLDPWMVIKKFLRFAAMDMNSPAAADFVLLEDWLNDGAPLAGPIARECLLGWYGANTPGERQWLVSGETVDPTKFEKPALVIVPGQDRIVPPASARALASPGPNQLPNATRLDLALGHIGMVVSARAPQMLWRPCSEFIANV